MRNILILLFCLPIAGFGQCIYGDCENGTNAIAEYVTQNGGTAKYEGDFKNGKRNGNGKYYENDELIYDGDWKDGRMDGKGEYYQDGELFYAGDMKDDRRDGRGKYYSDGELFYDGDWIDGRRDGRGKYYSDGELLYDGDWIDGRRTGNGKMYQNGRLYYKGEIIDGVKNGVGTYYHENGTEYNVVWIDGKTGENIYNPNDIKGSELNKCEIPLINNFGNNYLININVNGIKKQYVYDPGASYFTINSEMEKNLISQGKIKNGDYYPPKRFKIASGEIIEQKIVRLDNIKIGDYIVNNVFATIIESNDDGVLLCGLGLLKKKFSQEGRMGNILILFR